MSNSAKSSETTDDARMASSPSSTLSALLGLMGAKERMMVV
jgi:hypothetical protein